MIRFDEKLSRHALRCGRFNRDAVFALFDTYNPSKGWYGRLKQSVLDVERVKKFLRAAGYRIPEYYDEYRITSEFGGSIASSAEQTSLLWIMYGSNMPRFSNGNVEKDVIEKQISRNMTEDAMRLVSKLSLDYFPINIETINGNSVDTNKSARDGFVKGFIECAFCFANSATAVDIKLWE